MQTLLLVLNLVFTVLNLVVMIPVAKIVVDLAAAFKGEPEPKREPPGLVEVETPQVNYHHFPPPTDLL